ncbi:MAG: DUF6057 family protein, partial [Solirubrobacterales bacterium]
ANVGIVNAKCSSTADEGLASRRKPRWLWAVVFLGGFLYVWKGIQSHLLYYGFGVFAAYPTFSWQVDSLGATFGVPGGPVGALAALLAQSYRNPLLGAVVIVAVAGTLLAGVRRLLAAIQAEKFRDSAWASVVVALMIYNRYDDPMASLLAMGVSVWLAALYLSIPLRTTPVRAGAFLVELMLGYYLAGGAILVFACTACLVEVLVRRQIVLATAEAVLACVGCFALGGLVFGLGPRAIFAVGTLWDSAWARDFSSPSRVLTATLYASVPALIGVAAVARLRPRKAPRPIKKADKTGRRGISGLYMGTVVRVLIVTVVAVLSLGLSRSHIHNERLLHYYSQQRDWDRVIALAHRMHGPRSFTRSAVFDIDRALAHQGRLGEELCVYPQDETKTLFLSYDDMTGRLQHAKLLELYLDLGCPNAAEKNAYELLDNEGPSPRTLEALIRIHLVKGEYESARVAFEALRRYAGSGEYVRRWRDVIADPARAQSDPLIRGWRGVQGTIDHAVGGISFEPLLKRVLQETPDHRPALEYLLAQYLLKHQRAEFVSCLPLLKSLGCTRLPRQYAEAVLVYCLEAKTSPETLGWAIESDVGSQFRQIRGIIANARGDNQAAFNALSPGYAGTYVFYSLFNACGTP